MKNSMRKIFVAILVLLASTQLYARVIFQTDTLLFNGQLEYSQDCFYENPKELNAYYQTLGGFHISLGYEFQTDNVDNRFHYFAGASVGGMIDFLSLGAFAGFNCHMFDTDHFRFELMATLEGGEMSQIKGWSYYYVETKVDLVANLKNRRFPYVGVGLSNINTTNINIFKEFGTNIYFLDALSLHIVAGLRL